MEVLQLSVLDLPPVNPLGIMPRFGISGKDAEAIAKLAEAIGEIRLDQLPEELAGKGKSDRHTQAAIPMTIEAKSIEDKNDKFLENPINRDSFPEILEPIPTHGYVEHYFVIGKNKKVYFYTRYVYQDISGKLRHHHISKKQTEAIAALWKSGASAKEICVAIGKKYLGKDIS
ncbi:hypothetical protein [Pseudanabaena sp. 'Roaring Creek']|uniref:hypothetical protein n=1 Tax=Pseudanabaena sp. 'Roaring Creek' TaxID=1681830 RepID=UPI0012E26965|nr:hypothetical protein [Pseudanabaena sp. 'Roaring Creek']